jgi:HAE1 family hydrophobic/amphiphilic exporter-1
MTVKLVRFAVTHPVTISMATVASLVFGLVALGRLDTRLLPEIRYPSLTIQIEFPNTAPLDVENLLTHPIEEAVGVVPGLRKVHSISQAGLSQVTLEFDWDTAMDYAALEVREKVDLVSLPEDAEPPMLLKYDPSLDPILRIGLSGSVPLVQLRNVAEDVLKREIETLPGVAAAKVAGGLEEEIQVHVDEQRLAALGIPISAVNDALTEENVNASGGRLRDHNAEYLVRTLSRFEDLDSILDVAVGVRGEQPIRLADVATVHRGHKERTSISHVNGRESVDISIHKEGDENIVEIASRVKRHISTIEDALPSGMKMEVLFDQSIFISQATREVMNNALLGGILSILVIYLFLRDIRSTLIISFSIPISLIATFILMYTQNVSLNVMSLGGLAIGVGMVVDNSIVVLEAIHRRREDARAAGAPDDREPVVTGTSEVGGAIAGSTLTTVAVFVPIVFIVEGISGQIFGDQALTVTFSLLASLLVALTFTPMLASLGKGKSARDAANAPSEDGAPPSSLSTKSWRDLVPENRLPRWLRTLWPFLLIELPARTLRALNSFARSGTRLAGALERPFSAGFERGYARATASYEAALRGCMRRRHLVLGSVALLVLLSSVLFARLGSEIIPPLSQGQLTLAIEMAEGVPLSKTERVVAELGRELRKIDGIALQAANVGLTQDSGGAVARLKENRADIHLKLESASRELEIRVLEEVRALFASHPEVSMKVRRPSLLTFNTPIEVDVFGYNLDDLMATANRVAAELRAVEGARDVQIAMLPGSPEIRIAFDREKLSRLGLRLSDVANTVRGKVRGSVASQFRDQEKHIDIRVQNAADQRNTLSAMRELIVAEREGVPITLGAIASLETVQGPAEIHRLGRKRAAIVSANLAGRDLGSATEELESALARLPLPANIELELGGQNEEMQRSFRSLKLAILLAIFLVYLVMAAQFESLVYPFIIMFTVPLALCGAVIGLALTGTPLSILVAIGGIMLAGIVVNNGIVLVDRINQFRKRRIPLTTSVVEASLERLRPILMTSGTTVLGLLPMAIGLGEGAELRAPLAITVIFGLSVATLLTLVVVPVAYTLLTPAAEPERPLRKRVESQAAALLAPSGGGS